MSEPLRGHWTPFSAQYGISNPERFTVRLSNRSRGIEAPNSFAFDFLNKEYMSSEKMIVLFDEYGTPTLRQDRESEFFIGVGACYKNSDELLIFDQIESLIGLQNKKPLKNNRISTERATKIAEALKQLPIFLVVVAIDLSKSRIDAPGALHHIIVRGIERRKVFFDDTAARELGISMTDLSRKLKLALSGVSQSVIRGEKIA